MDQNLPGDGEAAFSIGSDTWPGVTKVVEEVGELLQVLGKLQATGGRVDHWDGSNLKERLEDEIADVRASLEYVEMFNDLDGRSISKRVCDKVERFMEWHRSAKSQAKSA